MFRGAGGAPDGTSLRGFLFGQGAHQVRGDARAALRCAGDTDQIRDGTGGRGLQDPGSGARLAAVGVGGGDKGGREAEEEQDEGGGEEGVGRGEGDQECRGEEGDGGEGGQFAGVNAVGVFDGGGGLVVGVEEASSGGGVGAGEQVGGIGEGGEPGAGVLGGVGAGVGWACIQAREGMSLAWARVGVTRAGSCPAPEGGEGGVRSAPGAGVGSVRCFVVLRRCRVGGHGAGS